MLPVAVGVAGIDPADGERDAIGMLPLFGAPGPNVGDEVPVEAGGGEAGVVFGSHVLKFAAVLLEMS